MLTRKQIEEIQTASGEQGVSVKKILEEKGIPANQYFWWKRKYAREAVQEGFLPVANGSLPAVMGTMASPSGGRGKAKADPAAENWMSIELRTVAGTYTILKSV